MKLLREYIKALLTEAAMGPADLPDSVFVAVKTGRRVIRIFYAVKNSDGEGFVKSSQALNGISGTVMISASDDPCGDAWEVVGATAKQGWGPMLYDVAMEYATQNGGGLISDRVAVSPHARNVWDYYMANRSDVTGIQMDNLENTLTPEDEDNCDQKIASYTNQYNMPKNVDWQTSPLSKRYTKSPTAMNALEAAGKLVIL